MISQDTPAPFISIVIPVYNRPEDLVRALNSLVTQTQTDFEVIVVDDGSTENIKKVTNKFSDLLNLQLIRIENSGGPARPRNVGVQAAQGNWISFLDSDDWWFPGRLAEVSNVIKKNSHYDVFYHKLKIVCDDRKINWWSSRNLGWSVRENTFDDLMIRGNAIPNSSVVLRKQIFERVGPLRESEEFSSVEDFDYWLRIGLKKYKFYFIKKTLGFYWLSSSGISSNPARTVARNKLILDRYLVHLPEELRSAAISKFEYFAGSIWYAAGEDEKAIKHLKSALQLSSISLKLKRLYKIFRLSLYKKNEC